jgi:hypothetical protein
MLILPLIIDIDIIYWWYIIIDIITLLPLLILLLIIDYWYWYDIDAFIDIFITHYAIFNIALDIDIFILAINRAITDASQPLMPPLYYAEFYIDYWHCHYAIDITLLPHWCH